MRFASALTTLHTMFSASRSASSGLLQRVAPRFPKLPRCHDLQVNRSLSSSANQKGEPISIWYPIIGGFVVTVAGGFKYMHDHVEGTEGLMRTFKFYKFGIPKYIEYRWHMFRKSSDEAWAKLDHETATTGLELAYELEGFYIKAGQMVAANIGGAFPEVWQDTMSVLQDQVPPQEFSVIKKIVANELEFDSVFATFDETPIGSAAIGQVHRATLKDGTPVVVKVRYPNVEKLLRGDIRTIKMFAQVAQPVHVPALEEIEKQFMTEFDYVQEAQQLETVRQNLFRAGLEGPGKLCRVPKAYLEYCTTRVLVMEELHGGKLADGLKEEMRFQAMRQGKTTKEYLTEVKKQEKDAKEKGEELKGPSADDYDVYISLLNKQRQATNFMRRIHNWSVGLVPGVAPKPIEDKSNLPINHAKLVEDLLHIHGHEILVDGYFNGDPHPGNILLLRGDDGTPGLGLIDYGQVKKLSKETRHLFARLVIALDDGDKDRVVELMKEAGMKTKNMNKDVIYLYAKVSYDEINDQVLQGKHVQMFMEDLEARDPVVQLPKELLMASRCSLLLRGLAQALHQNRRVSTAWRPIAERVLNEDL
eukprot:Nitzschia sp. Nitz4//scaffold4_size323378//22787//24687//NITZ4_000612-RA/size323378-snap-gene-0.438-mRNA-1//-1//CDS//3329553255//7761//frame0